MKTWRAVDGTVYSISKMETSHIKNCLRLIERSGYTWRKEYLKALNDELKIRETKLYKALK